MVRCESLVLYRIMYGNRVMKVYSGEIILLLVQTILKLFLRVVVFVGVMVE